MKRKLLIILSVVLSLCTMAFFASCSCNPTGNIENPLSESKASLKIISAPTTMKIGEVHSLVYVVEDGLDLSTLSFESSDKNVATIDKSGKLEAINVGQTIITGLCGESKAEFTLNVVKDEGIPQFLLFNYIKEDGSQTLAIGGKLSLAGYISYNGREFSDATINYSVDNPDILSVSSDGVVTAVKKGTATVTVKASWREIESTLLTKEILISVVDDAQIMLQDGAVSEIELYTIGNCGGKTYQTSYSIKNNVKYIVNGEDVTSKTTFSVIDNESFSGSGSLKVAQILGSSIRPVSSGSAKLKATVNIDGEKINSSVPIKVRRPVQESSKINFSVSDGEIVELNDMFGQGVNLVDAYQSGDETGTGTKLTLEGNKITDFNLVDVNVPQDDYVTVYDDVMGIKIHMTAYYKVIRSAQDLQSVYSYNSTSPSTTTGYFFVENDIVYDPTVAIKPFYNAGANTNSTFSGVFDGNGKVIEYAITRGGLFDTLRAATVKNASFIVKAVPKAVDGYSVGAGQFVILARNAVNVTIDNIYATYDCKFDASIANKTPTVSRGLGLFGATSGANDSITDVVLDLTNATVSNLDEKIGFSYGVIRCPEHAAAYSGTTSNVHVIWTNKTLYQYSTASGATKYFGTSSNDKAAGYTVAGYTDYAQSTTKPQDISVGITRHNDYNEAKEYFTENPLALKAFEGSVDTSYGLPYVGSKANLATKLGDTYYDGDTDDYTGDIAVVLPKSLNGKTITKIVNADNESVVYYDGSVWSGIPQNTSNEIVYYNAFVYGENDELLGATTIQSVKKVITTAKDLPSVYSYNSTAATTTTGYFLVANDIDAYTENVAITPYYNSGANTCSTFAGVFDGNGKVIEYAITRGGLFDTLRAATVKNASFIVKAVPKAVDGYSAGAGQFVILARNAVNVTINNIYATYDCTLDASIANKTPTVSRGLGLFGATSGANDSITNVVLDLSNATVSNLDETVGFSYGVIRCPEGAAAYSGTTSNVHVIWTNKTLYQYSTAGGATKYFGTSSNDKAAGYIVAGYTDYAQSTIKPQDISVGITRYDSIDAMISAGKTKVGNWTISADGANWVNN